MKMSIKEIEENNEKFIREAMYHEYEHSYSIIRDDNVKNLAVALSQKTINEMINDVMRQIDTMGFSKEEIFVVNVYFYHNETEIRVVLPNGSDQKATVRLSKTLWNFNKEEFEKFKKIYNNLLKIREELRKKLEKKYEEKRRKEEIEEKIKKYDELKEKVEKLEEKLRVLSELVRSELTEQEIIDFFRKKITEEQIEQIKEEYSEIFD